jgi:Zn-dependent M16 (insulinase) family peptidase
LQNIHYRTEDETHIERRLRIEDETQTVSQKERKKKVFERLITAL